MKIVEYIVVSGIDAADITLAVNAMLAKGWQPYGDCLAVQVRSDDGSMPDFYQPMVRYGTEEAFNKLQLEDK